MSRYQDRSDTPGLWSSDGSTNDRIENKPKTSCLSLQIIEQKQLQESGTERKRMAAVVHDVV